MVTSTLPDKTVVLIQIRKDFGCQGHILRKQTFELENQQVLQVTYVHETHALIEENLATSHQIQSLGEPNLVVIVELDALLAYKAPLVGRVVGGSQLGLELGQDPLVGLLKSEAICRGQTLQGLGKHEASKAKRVDLLCDEPPAQIIGSAIRQPQDEVGEVVLGPVFEADFIPILHVD